MHPFEGELTTEQVDQLKREFEGAKDGPTIVLTPVAIARLDVKPGDTLVVTSPWDDMAKTQRLVDHVRWAVGDGVRVLAVPPGTKLVVRSEATS